MQWKPQNPKTPKPQNPKYVNICLVLNQSDSLGEGTRFRDLGKYGLEAAQFLIVIKSILFIRSCCLAGDIHPTNMLDNISHVVVLGSCQLSASSDHNFVATFAKVLFIVHCEVSTALKPERHLRSPAVVRCSHLYSQIIIN